jgi:nucleoside-diphosphate-sugar epimerase
MRVVVTGANGFVGRHLCVELKAAGHQVVAAVRAADRAPEGAADRVVAIGDVSGGTDWRPALEGADAVIHLVSPPLAAGSKTEHRQSARRVILEGSLALGRDARDAGVRRLVFVSSIKALGERSHGRALRPGDPAVGPSIYGAAKAETERSLAALLEGGPTRLTMVRPPMVYGPGNRGSVAMLIRALDTRWGRWLPLGGVDNRRALVFVGNLVAALRAAVEDAAPLDRCFHVCDPRPLSTSELARLICRGLGRPETLVPGGPLRHFTHGGIAGRLYGSLDVDDTAIRAALGWVPSVSSEAGIARTIAWMRGAGLLSAPDADAMARSETAAS